MANQKTFKEKKINEKDHLLLDADALKIRATLRLCNRSMAELYDSIKEDLERENISQSFSTFKNILSDSTTKIKNRPSEVTLRRKTISLILGKIDLKEAILEIGCQMDLKKKGAMELQRKIEAGVYDDIPMYTDEEVLLHASKSLPSDRDISEKDRILYEIDHT